MKRKPRTHSHSSAGPGQTVTIRAAGAADAPALARLAELDSAAPPQATAMLVAEVDGQLRAAAPLGGGSAIADPFHHTAELVTMLSARARQLEAARSRPAKRRWLPIGLRRRNAVAGHPQPQRGFGG
jgi:hypothetical protein